jgi:NMD protein affecting ribosome stability and mRNA decay
MMQLCLRCGRHELAGSFCSFCRTAEYDLADHEHGRDDGNGCPLGSHLDPLDTSVGHIRAHLAKPAGDWLGPVVIRHHPRTAGYTVASDPEAPSWMRRRVAETRVHAVPAPQAGNQPPVSAI